MTTPYHTKYFAYELTRQAESGGVDRLSMALFDACVGLNLRRGDQTWKVRLIDEKFGRVMFDVEDI